MAATKSTPALKPADSVNKVKYTGRLAEPRRYRELPSPFASDEEIEEWAEAERRDFVSRLDELFAFYQVERGNFVSLAVKLAVAHVPGMRMEVGPRGRRGFQRHERGQLKIAVDEMIRNSGGRMSVAAATRKLAKLESWKSKLRAVQDPADALRKQYEKADERDVGVVRASLTGLFAGHIENVAAFLKLLKPLEEARDAKIKAAFRK